MEVAGDGCWSRQAAGAVAMFGPRIRTRRCRVVDVRVVDGTAAAAPTCQTPPRSSVKISGEKRRAASIPPIEAWPARRCRLLSRPASRWCADLGAGGGGGPAPGGGASVQAPAGRRIVSGEALQEELKGEQQRRWRGAQRTGPGKRSRWCLRLKSLAPSSLLVAASTGRGGRQVLQAPPTIAAQLPVTGRRCCWAACLTG